MLPKCGNDVAKRIYLSKGAKGVLGIKNSFIYEFKRLKICEIPNEYRKYFNIKDYKSIKIVSPEDVYNSMIKRLKDEIYLKVDAREGEDFLTEDKYGLVSEYDIKGKENHNINVKKLSLVVTKYGDTALDVIEYIYNRLLSNNPEHTELIKEMNEELDKMFEYKKEYLQELNKKIP